MESIEEIREWNEKYGPQQVGMKSVVDTLLAEIDRLNMELTLRANPEYADGACRDTCPELMSRQAELETFRKRVSDPAGGTDFDEQDNYRNFLSALNATCTEEGQVRNEGFATTEYNLSLAVKGAALAKNMLYDVVLTPKRQY